MTTTEWLPATVNPVHIGYYEVRYSWEDGSESRLSQFFWDGVRWKFRKVVDCELRWGDLGCEEIHEEFWRGLTECAA